MSTSRLHRHARTAAAAVALGGLTLACASALGVTVAHAAESITVGDEGYPTIASAIADVDPGGTVTVPAGTYDEAVVLNKTGVTLTGAQTGVSASTGPRNADTSTGEAIILGGVHVTAADVVVDGLEIRSTATVNGVLIDTSGTGAVLENNRFVGPGDDIGNYGVRNYLPVESINDNLFLNHRRAINHDGVHGADVVANDFRGNAISIATSADGGSVRDNTFEHPADAFFTISVYGEDNAITGNTFDVVGPFAGSDFATINLMGDTNRVSGNEISDNTFTGQGPALVVGEDSSSDDNVVERNAFLTTGTAIVNADADVELDASSNWWGARGNPAPEVATGDVVTAPGMTPEIVSFTAPVTVPSSTTAITPTTVLVNPVGVTQTVTGADSLAFGVNAVRLTAQVVIGGVEYDSATTSVDVTREKAQSSVALALSADRQVIGGTPVTATATVTVPDGGSSAGNVVFTVDDADAGTVATSAGSASWTLPAGTAVRTSAVAARFVPTTADAIASTSAAATVKVVKARTSVKLKASKKKKPIDAKKPIVLTATVEGQDGAAPKGKVVFRAKRQGKLATVAVKRGAAALKLKVADAGRYAVTATFVPRSKAVAVGSTSERVTVRLTR